jgi:hypothetical protein
MDRQKPLQGFAGVPMVKLDSIGTLLSMKTKIMSACRRMLEILGF